MTIEALHNIQARVNYILMTDPDARDSDDILYADYINTYCPDLADMPVTRFLVTDGIPSHESIGRARRKLQAEHPELKGSKRTQEARSELVEVFREYSQE